MAATYTWSETNLVGVVVTDGITNLNFGSNDSPNIVVATYPIVAGENSYQKYIRAKFGGSGWTEISNMKFWKSSGSYVTDEGCFGIVNVAYATPSKVLDGGDAAVPLTEGTAWAVQSAAGTATITAAGYTKYIRLQLLTLVTTPSGSVNQKIFTFQYDEV